MTPRPLRVVRAWALAALAVFLAALSAPALAQDHGPPPSTAGGARLDPTGRQASYSIWVIDGTDVRLQVILPKAAAYALPGPGKPPVRVAEAKSYVGAQFAVTSAAGRCPPIDLGEGFGEVYTMAQSATDYVYEMRFRCRGAEGMTLRDSLLFIRLPDHVNYARVQVNGGKPALQVFSRTRQAIPIAQSHRSDEIGVFAKLGGQRLLKGWDRLAVLLGLLLLVWRWKDLAAIAGGLAGGYVAAMATGASGLIVMNRPLGEAALGALIVILGAAGLRAHTHGPAPARWARVLVSLLALALAAGATIFAARQSETAGLMTGGLAAAALALIWVCPPLMRPVWLLAAPAAAFAFVDGMGPASDLARLDLPLGALLPALAGHGAGALGAGALLAGAAAGLLWVAGRRLAKWRNIPAELAGAALVGLGAFWFVSRTLS